MMGEQRYFSLRMLDTKSWAIVSAIVDEECSHCRHRDTQHYIYTLKIHTYI